MIFRYYIRNKSTGSYWCGGGLWDKDPTYNRVRSYAKIGPARGVKTKLIREEGKDVEIVIYKLEQWDVE